MSILGSPFGKVKLMVKMPPLLYGLTGDIDNFLFENVRIIVSDLIYFIWPYPTNVLVFLHNT